MTAVAPQGFRLADVDYSAEMDYRERTGKWDDDAQLPTRLRCLRCGWLGWGSNAAARHRKRCPGPVPDAVEFPPGPVWVDI